MKTLSPTLIDDIYTYFRLVANGGEVMAIELRYSAQMLLKRIEKELGPQS